MNVFIMNLRDHIEKQKDNVRLSILRKIDSYSDALLDDLEKFRPRYFKIISEDLNYIDLDQTESDLKQFNGDHSDHEPNYYTEQISKLKNLTHRLEYVDNLYQNSVIFEPQYSDIQIDFDQCFGRLKIGLYSQPASPDLTKTREINHFEASATCLTFFKSGEIACGTKGGMIKIWDPMVGKCIQKIKAHNKFVNCIKLGENERIYTCSSDGSIKIWDKETRKCVKTILSPNCSLEVIELWKDNIVSCDWSEVIRIWDVQTGECIHMLNDHESLVYCLGLIGSNRLISGSNDKKIILWDLEAFRSLKVFSGHYSPVMCLNVLDGNSFISGSKDGKIKIWNVDTNECLLTLNGHEKAVREFQVCENKEFISCSEDGNIKLWTELSDKAICELSVDNAELVCLKFLPTGGLATCDKTGLIRIFSE
ncbi:F-box WD repeat-containing 7 [Brachionus plicatilis]|uniref:F-box WD repeat-containing 7 n=1 Tax=Brachionus plicatilis TaxID=10195 RepID=A0A3M7S9S3_BRAPC|nr:F-box WD repeat-containing 7 [Brachionus plicatilis]